ncbi:MAG: hypothetical protein O2894_00770, partial [Planctomycetota bacterium]|nr:hypothetical protein [Planctomycetota bacterium]
VLILSFLIVGPVAYLEIVTQEAMQSDVLDEADYGFDESGDWDAENFDDKPTVFEEIVGSSQASFFGAQLLGVLAQLALSGALAFLVVRHEQRRPAGIVESLVRGLARLPQVIAATLTLVAVFLLALAPTIVAFALDAPGVGMLLLLVVCVPLMMFYYSAFVTVPVCAVERRGPIASIKRSRELCLGSRWMLFALLFVFGMISVAVAAVVVIPFAASGNVTTLLWASQLTEVVVTVPLSAILAAVAYVELRGVREGVDPDGIVHVFD